MYDEVDDCPVPPTANLRYTADDNNTGGRSMPGAQAIEGIRGTSGSGSGRGNYEEEDDIAKQRAKSQRGAERTIELHCSGTDPTPFNVAQLNDDEDDAAKQRIRDEMNVLHRSKPAATTPTAAASSPPTPTTDQLQQQEEMDQKPAATIVGIPSPPPPQQSPAAESLPDTRTTFGQAVSTLSSRFHREIEEPPSPTENSNYPEFELSDKPQPLPPPSFHRSRAHTRRNNQGSNNSTSTSSTSGANEDISSSHISSSGLPVLEATLVPEIPIYNATPVPEVDEREEEKDHGAGDDIKDDDIEKNLSANDDDDDGGGSKIFNSNDYDYDEQQLDQQQHPVSTTFVMILQLHAYKEY